MSQEEEKAKLFVSRLLANPTLRSLNPLQKEEQILNFMEINARQLYPTLSSSAFFPGDPWNKIQILLNSQLVELINESLIPGVQRQLFDKIDLGFISFLSQKNQPQDKIKEALFYFIQKVMANTDGRRELSGSYNAVSLQIVDKYIENVFKDHSYIHFELTKVQRLKMSKEEIINMIKASLLIRPAIQIYSADMHKENASGIITQAFADKVSVSLLKEIPSLPQALVHSAITSNLSFEEHKYVLATSRITSILCSLSKTIKPDLKVDRGAATPEKSWFSIARKNYKYFGWDIKMLDELYRFSAENNW